ncbi:hypothetical protein ACFVAV_14505 [Nocardia sp. NPDC057663]
MSSWRHMTPLGMPVVPPVYIDRTAGWRIAEVGGLQNTLPTK